MFLCPFDHKKRYQGLSSTKALQLQEWDCIFLIMFKIWTCLPSNSDWYRQLCSNVYRVNRKNIQGQIYKTQTQPRFNLTTNKCCGFVSMKNINYFQITGETLKQRKEQFLMCETESKYYLANFKKLGHFPLSLTSFMYRKLNM